MSNFLIEELNHRVNRLRDEQARANAVFETRIKELEGENKDVRNRLTVLTRLLIARQFASAEEIATALAAMAQPPTSRSEAVPMDVPSSPPTPESGATNT